MLQIAVERGLQLQEREFASEQERQYQTALDQLQAQKLQQVFLSDSCIQLAISKGTCPAVLGRSVAPQTSAEPI